MDKFNQNYLHLWSEYQDVFSQVFLHKLEFQELHHNNYYEHMYPLIGEVLISESLFYKFILLVINKVQIKQNNCSWTFLLFQLTLNKVFHIIIKITQIIFTSSNCVCLVNVREVRWRDWAKFLEVTRNLSTLDFNVGKDNDKFSKLSSTSVNWNTSS